MKYKNLILPMVAIFIGVLFILEPSLAFADFESSLENIQDRLINTFLPILAVIGLALAGISFATGNAGAKQHIVYALIGCVIGFGAESIVELVRSLVS